MTKEEKRVEYLLNEALLDTIYSVETWNGVTDVTGAIAGDVISYRMRGDKAPFTVTER